MLLLKTSCEELLKPLQAVNGIVERRHTMQILSNVLLENCNGRCRLTGTDLEMQIQTLGPATESEFRVTINAKKLQDILRALPNNVEVTLDQDQDRILLKAGKGRYNLQTLPAQDFPVINTTDEILSSFAVPQSALKDIISQVQYAMATQDIRFYLNGLLMQVRDKKLCVVSTDGHRLAYSALPLETDIADSEVIIPRKTILELFKLLTLPEENVQIELLPNQIRFSCNDNVIISKVVDGKFPDYKRVIPQDNNQIFLLNRQKFSEALERAMIFATERLRGARFYVQPNLLKIISSNNEQEEAHEELEIDYQGTEIQVGFNITYLLDVLRNIHCENVQLAFHAEGQSLLITAPEYEQFRYVVMPMKI